MQITFTFDASNKSDLSLLNKIIEMAQPQVAQNSGSTGSATSLSDAEASGVDGAGEAAGSGAAETPAPVTEKKARNPRVKKEEAPAEKPEVKSGEEWAHAADQAEKKAATLDDVRAALQSFTAGKGVPAGIELLKKYGAGRVSELAEENYAAFIAECA